VAMAMELRAGVASRQWQGQERTLNVKSEGDRDQ
jgi:hypothetical protein